MKILTNKNFWAVIFFVFLGTVLRLIFIDKPEGLWNDEYVSWAIASIPLGKKFFEGIATQCHMPFYYFYLKFFIHFFGNSDLMLRLTSVLTGVLSIIAMYFMGKEIKDEKLGIFCAGFSAISSFLIYFSQEVRFYSILFLFSALLNTYMIKLIKSPNIRNLFWYLIWSFLVITTHSIGFVFVFFCSVFASMALLKDEKLKPLIIKLWSITLITLLTLMPLIINIFTTHPLSQWWSDFSISKIFFILTDYFSPTLTNIVSAPPNFFYDLTLKFIIFAIIPMVIAIIGIILAVKKNEPFAKKLLSISLCYLATLIVMSLAGKLVLATKYSIEVYPALIAIVGIGLLSSKHVFNKLLIFLLCSINLFYLLVSTHSAPRLHRSEGHKIVADLIKNANLQSGDMIVLTYYPKERFEKYTNFNNYEVVEIDKGNFENYLGMKKNIEFKNRHNEKFTNEYKKNILKKLKKNRTLAILILHDVSVYSPTQMHILSKDESKLSRTPILFLAFSDLKNKLLEESIKNLQIYRYEERGSWALVTFKKN